MFIFTLQIGKQRLHNLPKVTQLDKGITSVESQGRGFAEAYRLGSLAFINRSNRSGKQTAVLGQRFLYPPPPNSLPSALGTDIYVIIYITISEMPALSP